MRFRDPRDGTCALSDVRMRLAHSLQALPRGSLPVLFTVSIIATVPMTSNLQQVRESVRAAAIVAGCEPIPSAGTTATSERQAAVGMRSIDGHTVDVIARCEIPDQPGDVDEP